MSVSIAVVCDTQCGSRSGLTPPEWQKPKMESTMKPHWEFYVAAAKEIGPVDACVALGDLTDGEGKKGTLDTDESDTNEQADMAIAILERIQAKKYYIVGGTPFHTAGTTDYEKAIARALKSEFYSSLLLAPDGIRSAWSHTGRQADTAQTPPSQLYKEEVREIIVANMQDYSAPQLAVRAHTHWFWVTYNAKNMAVSCPAMQLPFGSNARRYRSHYYDVGILKFIFDRKRREMIQVIPYLMPIRSVLPKEYICL